MARRRQSGIQRNQRPHVLTLNLSDGLERGAGRPRRYRFGFVLNTTIGNLTRYVNLRKYAARDIELDCTWTPVNHVLSPAAVRAMGWLPPQLAMRFWVLWQMWPALRALGRLDVVMMHLFEAEIACVARSYLFRRPALVSSTDEAPAVDPATYPVYPHQKRKPRWRRALRLWLDHWRASRIDAFIPFSAWGGRILEKGCNVPGERIYPIHAGLDLEVWQARNRTPRIEGARLRLLFVGADFERKGGPALLRVFEQRFADSAELHVVSAQAPAALGRHVHAHRDLYPNDPRLVDLYANCDLLVLPTEADLVPWVLLEAMAMGLPVVSTKVGAIADIVADGVTGLLVPAGDAEALAQAIGRLLADADLRRGMGERGRERVQLDFDAAVNVPRILDVMKSLVGRTRAADGAQPTP